MEGGAGPLLPDGTVLTPIVDTENALHPTHAEKYAPKLGKMDQCGKDDAFLPRAIPPTAEIGPARTASRCAPSFCSQGQNSNKTKAGHTIDLSSSRRPC